MVELLTVADHFLLGNRGLLVVPDFSVPDGWKVRSETVTIVLPDGRRREAKASLTVTHVNVPHVNIADEAAWADRRWRLMVSFPALTKEDVPIGSRVMVSAPLRAAIQRKKIVPN